MNFGDVSKSNRNLINRLERNVSEGHVSHAYIFEGPSNIDKIGFARAFIKGVLCPCSKGENCGACSVCDKIDHGNHEDIMYVEKAKASVKDEAVSAIQERLNTRPLGNLNVVVISDCDTMTLRAQNRLLKTLEEPPGNALILLLSENMENLTQTILSRCVKYRLETEPRTDTNSRAEETVKKALAGAPFYAIVREMEPLFKDKDKACAFLDDTEQTLRLLSRNDSSDVPVCRFDKIHSLVSDVETARKHILQGMSPGYVLKNLALKMQ